jgi:uncharacterized protein YcfJ
MKISTAAKIAFPVLLLGAALSGCGSTSHRGDNCTNIPGAVIGGVVGGAVGSQVGSGRGRDVAIGAGAATGAVVGSNVGDC